MRRPAIIFAMLTSSVPALSQEVDVPLTNWTVPPYAAASSGGMQVMTDVSGPRAFIPLRPCRIADTRGNAAPIQGGIFGNSEARDWTVTGICGIPSGADAISVNFTVVSAPATPQGGFLLAWPTGSPPVQTTAIMTYGPGVTVLSNAAIVPLSGAGSLTVNVSHSTHIIMDVNGYFSDVLGNPQNSFVLHNSSSLPTADFNNLSTSCSIDCGVRAIISSFGNGRAVSGWAPIGGTNSAGVFGRQSGGFTQLPVFDGAGVRGEGPRLGVLGITRSSIDGSVAVAGSLVNPSGGVIVEGYLGYNTSGTDYGVYATANIGGTGAKHFVEPHPTDPSKVIRYTSLEGPEAGTYFRGRGRFQRGMARIAVPEDFRMVTDAEGLSVQITPIGAMASFAVMKADLNEIVVQSSRSVEFYYLVQGVRRTHKHLTSPIGEGSEFMPRSAEATMPQSLTEEQQRLLVQNGTYKADGTVNMETAQRLGWDRAWAERQRPAPQPETP